MLYRVSTLCKRQDAREAVIAGHETVKQVPSCLPACLPCELPACLHAAAAAPRARTRLARGAPGRFVSHA
jgi:hypothetical protein